MNEIESNLASKEAQEYYKRLSEMQKKSGMKSRGPTTITIKNMRGGRTISEENIQVNEDGTPLSPEELEHHRKFIDFSKEAYPMVNPIDFLLKDYKGNGQVRIQNYRYPCAENTTRRGIVQLIHGFNDYAGRYAYLAKTLTQHGYDVVAMDQRGFGYSEGARGLI